MQSVGSWLGGVLLVVALAGGSAPGRGAERGSGGWIDVEDVPEEEIPGPPEETGTSPFLLESTSVRALVTGPVAHVVVTQSWSNPNPVPVDGLYIFPLPEGAAVTDMSLRIGERRIRGEMRRREEARALYEQARRQGRVAGLLDQERSNVFAQQVANIVPGARIEVILSLDHAIACEDGGCEYVFPTVVGPRFVPARQTDPGRIDPPVTPPGRPTGHRLSLSVEVNAGVTIHELRSPSHAVRVARRGPERARVTLDGAGDTRLDRDFRLRWRVGGEAPEVGLLAWRNPTLGREPGVFTLVVQPPAGAADEEASPRELVFVLDCSGSMTGRPLEAAKEVVRRALRAARSGDTFQIIRFSVAASALGPRPVPATPTNVARALRYLESLRGEGGTEMIAGIRAALEYPADPERLRIVAFLTDGYIGNEREILAAVRRRLGEARLFSFGIGSSVNRHLLEALAEEGRGAAAFLGPRETAEEMVERFVERIETPVLTDIRIAWQDLEVVDLEPARIPDLFAGQQLVVHGRYLEPGSGVVRVEGRRNGRREAFRRLVTLPEEAADHEALGRLWARSRIHRLDRSLHDAPRDDVREAIIALGLRHRLMTEWTSLVAVDSLVSNTTGSSEAVSVPVEMPQDVSYAGVFGQEAARAAAAAGPLLATAPPTTALERSQLLGRNLSDALALAPGITGTDYDVEMDEKAAPHGGLFDAPPAPVTFDRLILERADGTRLIVESDGDVWSVEGRSRTLVRALSPAETDSLRAALTAARPEGWAAAPAGVRLILESGRARRSVALPSGDPAVDALWRMLESWSH